MLIQISVAWGTIGLAFFAFYTIYRQRKEKHFLSSPIFTLTHYNLQLSHTDQSVDGIKLTVKNVGHGPAFNLSIFCAQGSSRFESRILSDGYTLEGKPDSSYTLNHLGEKEESNWSFSIIKHENQETNANMSLFIFLYAMNLYGDKIEQFFSVDRSTGAKTLHGTETPEFYFWRVKLKNQNC